MWLWTILQLQYAFILGETVVYTLMPENKYNVESRSNRSFIFPVISQGIKDRTKLHLQFKILFRINIISTNNIKGFYAGTQSQTIVSDKFVSVFNNIHKSHT